MNLQPYSEQITVQQEFLHQTAGKIHKVGNVTLDASAFEGVVKAGTVVVIGANDLASAYDGGTYTEGHIVITTNDIEVKDKNVQVGALEEAYVRADRITNGHAELEAQSNYRFKVR